MIQTLNLEGLTFRHVITPTMIDGADSNGEIVRYEDHHGQLESLQRGVYVVTVDGEIAYIGKFSGDFAKRWLYTNLRKLYHHKRHSIADALKNGKTVHVFASTEEDLRSSIPTAAHDSDNWINIHGIESSLIRRLQPMWNDMM
jgi:hypothetical protein